MYMSGCGLVLHQVLTTVESEIRRESFTLFSSVVKRWRWLYDNVTYGFPEEKADSGMLTNRQRKVQFCKYHSHDQGLCTWTNEQLDLLITTIGRFGSPYRNDCLIIHQCVCDEIAMQTSKLPGMFQSDATILWIWMIFPQLSNLYCMFHIELSSMAKGWVTVWISWPKL